MKTIECKMTLKAEQVKALLDAWLEAGTEVALKLSKPVKDLDGDSLRVVEMEGNEEVIAALRASVRSSEKVSEKREKEKKVFWWRGC